MIRIIGISGSLRKGSFNSALLRAASEAGPEGVTVEALSIREIPLYDGDVEGEQGIPGPVSAIKERIASSDGLLLVTPEYNSSVPGVLKNAMDWLSRPPEDIPRVFAGKPVAILGATPGEGGTRFSQTAWLPVLRNLGMRPWFGRQLYVASAASVFDESGALTDERTRKRLESYMSGFSSFIRG